MSRSDERNEGGNWACALSEEVLDDAMRSWTAADTQFLWSAIGATLQESGDTERLHRLEAKGRRMLDTVNGMFCDVVDETNAIDGMFLLAYLTTVLECSCKGNYDYICFQMGLEKE